jgi:uncharacterized protein
MITDMDKAVIVDLARKYRAEKVLLFGSSLSDRIEARDIDLGVAGISPRDFFRFYADLLLRLSKPVDVVDLTRRTAFTSLVLRDGVPLYG